MQNLKRSMAYLAISMLSLSVHAEHEKQLPKSPKYVMLMRHAEKTAHKEEVHFEQWHLKNAQPLSTKGEERAEALTEFFTRDPEMLKYGSIFELFAPNPAKNYLEVRPIQTITPLSKKIHKKVQHPYDLGQEAKLVQHILNRHEYFGKTILICYEHKHIPVLANFFVAQTKSSGISIPQAWPFSDTSASEAEEIFDRVWVLEFDIETGRIVAFYNLPQRLMFGDATA